MELSSTCKIFTSIILIGSVIACKEDNDKSNVSLDIQEVHHKEVIAPSETQNEIPVCQELGSSIQAMSVNSVQDFGDGSDGDFYLASGEVGFLEDREYNFNNIYLESNSTIKVSDLVNTDSAFIKINALGSCDLYGDLNFEGYKGVLKLACYGQFNLGRLSVDSTGGVVALLSDDTLAITAGEYTEENGDEGSGAIISNGDDLIGVGLTEAVVVIGLDDFVFSDITIIESPPVITVLEPDTMIEADPDTFYICINKP